MVYRAIGLMSGSSLDGLDIAFVYFEETGGKWRYDIRKAKTVKYTDEWQTRLRNGASLSAYEFVQLDNDYGRFLGEQVNLFIEENQLQHQVQFIASHGHTIFHSPKKFITTQIGNGAQIAALTNINVISDLRALDVALGGQGAPIVPVGEQLLFTDEKYFLNIGGIANLSLHLEDKVLAFDVCVANQALNYFAEKNGKAYDENGAMARSGHIHSALLAKLNTLDFQKAAAPKSLSNQYFKEIILPVIREFALSNADILCTCSEHIATQVAYGLSSYITDHAPKQLLITGGGAFNGFLIERVKTALQPQRIEISLPSEKTIQFKEALIMAVLGIVRWRQENTVLASVTGAQRPSIGGAVWIGQEY